MPSGYVASVFLLVGANLAALLWMGARGDFGWVEENAPVENLQVAVLFAASLTLLWRFLGAPAVGGVLSAGAAAVSAMFLVRELDLRRTWVPSSIAELFHEGDGKDVLILAIGASFVILVLLHWRCVIPALRALLRPRAAAYIVPGILLVTAGMFERLEKLYGAKLWVAFEEMTELNGYALLLLAGLFLPFHDVPSSAAVHASERGSRG